MFGAKKALMSSGTSKAQKTLQNNCKWQNNHFPVEEDYTLQEAGLPALKSTCSPIKGIKRPTVIKDVIFKEETMSSRPKEVSDYRNTVSNNKAHIPHLKLIVFNSAALKTLSVQTLTRAEYVTVWPPWHFLLSPRPDRLHRALREMMQHC